jgi:alpha-amylase
MTVVMKLLSSINSGGKADRIKKSGFTLVWFPPPSDSVNKHGYEPRELNKLDSEYGSEAELKAAIAKLSPVKAIADIVINHRSGSSSESDFRNPDWDAGEVVVSGDEGSGRESMNMVDISHISRTEIRCYRGMLIS